MLEEDVNWSRFLEIANSCSAILTLPPKRTLFKDFSNASFKVGLIDAPLVCMAIDGPILDISQEVLALLQQGLLSVNIKMVIN